MKLRSFLLLLLIVSLSACAERVSQIVPIRFEAANVAQATVVAPTATLAVESASPATGTPVTAQDTVTEVAFKDNLPLAARVNGQPILLDTYEKQVTQMVQALQAQGIDLSSEDGQETLTQVRRQILEALIDQKIIEQQAAELGLSISEETVEAEAQGSIAEGQGEVQFAEWLAANNLTYEEFKETLRSQLIANQLFETITGDVPETAEQIHLHHIQVADEATAQAIIEQLKSGADFDRLAQEQSLDESSRANGGDLGWFARGQGPLPAEVEAIAFNLQPGQINGPIQYPLGFYIIKLEAREVNRPLTNEMRQAVKQQQFSDWLAEQRSEAVIEQFADLP